MIISKEIAQELVSELYGTGSNTTDWEDFPLNWELMEEEIEDTSRWSIIYSRVYKDLDTGKFYATSFRVGATECQDESPYEYDGDQIEFVEVEPVEVKVIQYKVVE